MTTSRNTHYMSSTVQEKDRCGIGDLMFWARVMLDGCPEFKVSDKDSERELFWSPTGAMQLTLISFLSMAMLIRVRLIEPTNILKVKIFAGWIGQPDLF
ncbi:hypothetical protein TNCV_3430261 [Trichonephila clavipes]|nr:hypothetical protein TNCV_3430261 [Trichonephila clavipes]